MNIIDKFHNWRRRLRWDKQYRNGRWNNLKNDKEKPRYQTIIEFSDKYGINNPEVLDLGCGEGILCERMTSEKYTFFLGVDFSRVSINLAKNKNLGNAEFITADLHSYRPDKKFDVIVFNEAFYYIHNSEKKNVLNTMKSCLKEKGIIINSIYREGIGCWEYFDAEDLEKLDFKTIMTADDKTYWKIGVFKKI